MTAKTIGRTKQAYTKLTTLSGVGDHYEFSSEDAARKCAEETGGTLCVYERSTGTLWIVRLKEE